MHTVKSQLRNIRNSSRAAVDLGAVMIAVVILGIIGAVTAATVFVIIPWVQDSSAKQALSSISAAQESYKTAYDVYGNLNNLIEKDLMNPDPKLCTTASADGKTYTSASKSDTGKVFMSDTTNTEPRLATSGTSTCFGVLGNGGVFTPNPNNPTNPGTTTPPNGNVPKPPATPIIQAAWNSTPKTTTGSMVNSPFCEPGNVLEYRWKTTSTNTTTAGTWSGFSSWSTTATKNVSAAYGTKYDFQNEIRCRNTATNVTSDTQASNIATVTTPIPTPAKPTVTSTELSQYQTRWNWTATCATGTPLYSWADWRNGSTANDELNFGADTGNISRIRDTTKEGYTYSTVVKVKCKNDLVTSDWSGTAESRYLREMTTPVAPDIRAGWSSSSVLAVGAFNNAPTCATSNFMEYRWRYTATNTTTAGTWKPWTLYSDTSVTTRYNVDAAYGTKYEFQAEIRCKNTDTNAISAAQQSNVADYTTPIPTPSAPTVTSTELSQYQTRWNWAGECAPGTTLRYSWADWRDGSTASNPLSFSADTGNISRIRDTTKEGNTYSTVVKVHCYTGLVDSGWSPTAESRYLRAMTNPVAPDIRAGWSSSSLLAVGAFNNAPTCATSNLMEYRWKYAATRTETAGTWKAWTSFTDPSVTTRYNVDATYGTNYTFQAQIRCKNTETDVTSDIQSSNTADYTTPIPKPAAPDVTATEVSATQTRWNWASDCPTGTTTRYSWADWKDGATANDAPSFSADTGNTSRTRDTTKEGNTYSTVVKVHCYTGLVDSGWSDTNEARWTRSMTTPVAPDIRAGWSSTNVLAIGAFNNTPTCATGNFMEYRWRYAATKTATAGTWKAWTLYSDTSVTNRYEVDAAYGANYTFQAEIRCKNTDTNVLSAAQQSNIADVTTTIPKPAAPDVTATELSTTQTRWNWVGTCPTGTTLSYSWADWRNGSTADNPLSFSADTGNTSRTRDTTKEGQTYSTVVKVKCATDLVTSSWSDTNEARYTRGMTNPVAPDIRAGWSSTNVLAIGAFNNAPTCATSNTMEYRWKYAATRTETAGTWNAWTSFTDPITTRYEVDATYGTKYDFQAQIRCKNTETNATSDIQSSNVATYTTPIPKPAKPDVTATELSDTQTRWNWASDCPTGTTTRYSWADWKDGATADNALSFSADTGNTSRTRDTTKEGNTYSTVVKVHCYTGLVDSGWSDTNEARYTRSMTTPATPDIRAGWSSTNVQVTGAFNNAPTCATSNLMEYRWRYAATKTATAGAWKAWTLYSDTSVTDRYTIDAAYGAKYDFQAEIRCRNTDTNVVSTAKQSNIATVTTSIPKPAKPSVTATELSTSQTRWDWSGTCVSGTTPTYSYADWKDGATANDALSFSADTASVTRTRDTSRQGYTYSVVVKVKCETDLVSSSWSDNNEDRYLRGINTPGTPTIKATWDATNVDVIGSMTNTPTCTTGNTLQYRWHYAATRTETPGDWKSWTSFTDSINRTYTVGAAYGVKYDFQVEVRCNNAETAANSDSKQSTVASVTTPIPTPAAPDVTATELSDTQTRWNWSGVCPSGTTLRYSYADWRNGSTAGDPLSFSADTGNTSRTRDTSREGYIYRTVVKMHCYTGLVDSGWSDTNEARYTRNMTAPNEPFIFAGYNSSTKFATGNVTNAVTCATGNTVQYRWHYASTNTTTAGTFTSYGAFDDGTRLSISPNAGTKYTFQVQARCKNDDTGTVSGTNESTTASVITPISAPSTTMTVTELSDTQTRWAWNDNCPAGTTAAYKYGDWRDGTSTGGNAITFSNETIQVTRTRDTSRQGYTYSVSSMARCYTALADSGYGDATELKWTRGIDTPAAPGANLAVADNGSYETATLSWGSTCGTGTSVRYIWTSNYENNPWTSPETTQTSGTIYLYDGYQYNWSVRAKCVNTDTSRQSAWSSTSTNSRLVPVRNPNVTGWNIYRQDNRTIMMVPQVTCRVGVARVGLMTPGSWSSWNPWTVGPNKGKTGWYVDDPNWMVTGARDSNGNFYTGAYNGAGDYSGGSVFSAKGLFYCLNDATGRTSGTVYNDSGGVTP